METKTLKNRITTGFVAVADALPITATNTYNEVKMKNSPCYKCPNRTPECHGKYEAYAEYANYLQGNCTEEEVKKYTQLVEELTGIRFE